MTKNNEEIIIDGVDVSGCIHYEEYFEEDEDIKIKDFCALWYNSCHSCNNHTCYYKQLKRKEQECDNLQGEISHYEHDLGWCSSLIDLYEEKLMKTFYALHQIQLHNLKIKDKDIHLILKEVKEDLKEYNKMKNEELDKKIKDE